MFFDFQRCAIWAAETHSALSAVTECSAIENNEKEKSKHSFPVDMQHTDVEWKKLLWEFIDDLSFYIQMSFILL